MKFPKSTQTGWRRDDDAALGAAEYELAQVYQYHKRNCNSDGRAVLRFRSMSIMHNASGMMQHNRIYFAISRPRERLIDA